RIRGPRHRRRRPRPGHDRAADPHAGRDPAGHAAADRRIPRSDRAGGGHRDARRLRRQRGAGAVHLPGPGLAELSADDRRLAAGDRPRARAGPRPPADPADHRTARGDRPVTVSTPDRHRSRRPAPPSLPPRPPPPWEHPRTSKPPPPPLPDAPGAEAVASAPAPAGAPDT